MHGQNHIKLIGFVSVVPRVTVTTGSLPRPSWWWRHSRPSKR